MLHIRDLSVSVDQKELLRCVELQLDAGQVHFLLGPNGAGKSSLMYALMGHPRYVVTGGSIVLDGVSVANFAPEERSKHGLFMAFQTPPALPGVSVHMILQEALRVRYAKDAFEVLYERTADALALLEIDRAWLYRSLDKGFSGGERKLLELFQMMVLQPKYILLDEIDAGLDVDVRARVLQALRSYRAKHPACVWLLTSHQGAKLLSAFDDVHVHVMSAGRLVSHGNGELVSRIERNGYHEWQQ